MSVLIVGAGPTGLLLAIWLKTLRPSLQLRIVDRASCSGTTSRAIVIHARTLEFYRQLGLVDKVIENGKVLEGITIVAEGIVRGGLKFGNIGGDTTKYPFVLILPQDKHEELLVQHLSDLGTQVEWNADLEKLSQDEEKVSAELGTGEKLSADYVAGYDGSRSAVRAQLGVEMDGDKFPTRFYVADVDVHDSRGPVTGLRFNLKSNLFGVTLPLESADDDSGQQKVRVLGVVPFNLHSEKDVVFETFSARVEELAGCTLRATHWSSIYSVHHRVAAKFRVGRVFLLGDAAHIHSPVGGQGMNTGLGDATNLAWKLVEHLDRAGDDRALLDSYEIERRAFALKLVETVDRAFQMMISETWLGSFLRNLFFARILPTLWMLPFVPKKFFQAVSQLGISYRPSPLSGGDRTIKGPLRSGDRLPWTGGAGVDNYAVLNGVRWEVHRYNGSGDDHGETAPSGLPLRSFAVTGLERFGLCPDHDYLVRPDGYIASISPRST